MDWLLLVHIGPVQDFIMSARRCRDLWFGSRLLSELSREVARSLHQGDVTSELIFPGALEKEESGIANKVVVVLKNAEEDQIKLAAEKARSAMEAKLLEIAESTFSPLRQNKSFQYPRAIAHIKTLMEFMWVAVPITEDGYSAARTHGERLLAARKNTRDWMPPPVAASGIPKSSLDGVRESVVHEDTYDQRASNRFLSPETRRRMFGIKGEERLCGVGILKRLGVFESDKRDGTPIFHSAGHIASAGVRRRIAASAEAQAAWNEYHDFLTSTLGQGIEDLRIGGTTSWNSEGTDVPSTLPISHVPDPNTAGLDGIVLFPSRLKDLAEVYQDVGIPLRDSQVKELEEKHRDLLRTIKVRDPHPYYAVLIADGDEMGVAIDTLTEPSKHQEFSKALDEHFALKAKDLIQKHGGSLIFAGGDDVIALLPLFTALQAARELRNLFATAMNKAGFEKNVAPTLSVGLGITHFLKDFAEARAVAKEAEQLAKEQGRNRLAIILDKRGGVPRNVVGKWLDLPSEEQGAPEENRDDALDQRLLKLTELLSAGDIPRGFAHQLLDETRVGKVGATSKEMDEIVLSLAQRVVRRRELGKALTDEFLRLLHPSRLNEKQSASNYIEQLANELLIANELRLAYSDAGITFGKPTDAQDDQEESA